MTARRWFFFSLSTLAVACATAYRGFLELFSVITPYDDTGYALSVIKGFNEHGHLYQKIFSQYGPFFPELYYFICGIAGVPATHDGIRWVVLAIWLVSSIAGALLAFRLTGRIWMAILAQLICFHTLDRLAWEAGHPTSLIVLGVAFLALCLGSSQSERPRFWQAIAIGMGLAFLTVKVNIAIFALAAVGTAWIYTLPLDFPGKALRYAAVFLFTIPFLLIQTSWPASIRAYFAILFTCSLLSVLISASARARTLEWRTAARFGLWCLVALVLTFGFSIAGALLSGSTWSDMIDGLIITPRRCASALSIAPPMGPFEVVSAIIGLLLAVTWRFSFRGSPIRQAWLTFGLRLLFLTTVIVWLATSDHYLSLVLPLVWVAALPFNQEKFNTPVWQFGQLAIVLFAVGQVLGLYPVYGAQGAPPFYLGSICAILVVASLGADFEMKAQSLIASRRTFAAVVTIALFLVVIGASWRVARIAYGRYHQFSSLDLPGATLLRSSEANKATYGFLVANLRNSRPSFLTIPGVNSLYNWLEREPPTGFNVGMNFSGLSAEQQRAMVDVGRTCQPIAAVLNRKMISFWTRGYFQPSGPLIDFVTKECRSVGRVNNYELMALLDAPSPEFTSCVTLDKEWRTDAPGNQITAFLPANIGAITSETLLQDFPSGTSFYHFENSTTPDTIEKEASAPTSEPRRLLIHLPDPRILSKVPLDQTLIQLKDDAGRVINLPFLRPPERRRSK